MARLHEYQGKAILQEHGLATPRGGAIRTPDEAFELANSLGGRVVLKVQAWITGRKAKGGVLFADTPGEARTHAAKLLSMQFGNFPVTEVLVEEMLDIRDELFISLTIDDAAAAPLLLLDCAGGSGIEDRADAVARIPIDVGGTFDASLVQSALNGSTIEVGFHDGIIEAIGTIIKVAKTVEARSVEVNPLVTLNDGRVMAGDCRMTIDDYAVFRHPELGIEIARELDHPATALERVAYDVENSDHRGTFYFAQLMRDDSSDGNVIGFHGAGGGGSMMSMDAVTNAGFTLANFCDTSGNPSAAKVYRAARIILSQPDLIGYFGSGSGVASQEQYHSAYGLAKAFLEMNLSIPAVLRLGGNSEDRAVEILEDACRDLPARVEGYKKDDAPGFCAERFRTLVESARADNHSMRRSVPTFVGSSNATHFDIDGGAVWIDTSVCDDATTSLIIEHGSDLLKRDDGGLPTLAVSPEDIASRDSELIALEIECRRAGKPVVFVDLNIPGLEDALQTA